ncbi:MAG TPA: family 1 glycosylhydrolase [Verrucomicrobiae bacterium]|nr:family 1 glycosylhydrolase [Verrucomicrobiae bacterium]
MEQQQLNGALNGTFLKFPEGFLWGTATSTTQIEGHISNEWTDFVARDGNTCGIACDSYHRYVEDIEWMRQLAVNAYRTGIEWSRLQSRAYGPLNQAELARYIDQLDRLNAAGIVPMVVLHHFSNPPWINSIGGWTNRQTIDAFVDYVGKLVPALRGHVRIWNTFNEPDTYGCCAYVIGEFPPLARGRLGAFRTVVRNMGEAHRRVCRVIREAGSTLGPVEVGFSKNWTYFKAHSRYSAWDATMAACVHSQFNDFVLESFVGGPAQGAATFLGVNYYGRIRFHHFKPLLPTCGFSREQLFARGIECDDMLERHPAGLESALLRMYATCRLPIYLTEHGSSSTDEAFRTRDLRENLKALHRALSRGVDIRGFYYWSLLDNFEWQFGYSKKFGLLSVDFNNDSRPRAWKPLAQVYRRICRENSLPANEETGASPPPSPESLGPNLPAQKSATPCA